MKRPDRKTKCDSHDDARENISVLRIHHLGTINTCAKFYTRPTCRCSDISLQPADGARLKVRRPLRVHPVGTMDIYRKYKYNLCIPGIMLLTF